MVTETPINSLVNLSTFDMEYNGGHGDADYTITFTQSRGMAVYTVSELNIAPTTQTEDRPPMPANPTYTVVAGDSLWRIAERQLNSGARWTEIYELNKSLIKDQDLIYPGQVFTLPV